MSRVLIVEDQPAVANALAVLFEVHEIPFVIVNEPSRALNVLEGGTVGVVIQDMNFSPGATSGDEGVSLFRSLRRADPAVPVLLMTAWTSLETAVQLIREGASDYVAKPWDDDKLLASVRNLLKIRALQAENERIKDERARSRAELASHFDLAGIVYESESMHRLVTLAARVAAADVPILITGPNGSGKEKIAEIVQANSRRRESPFVKVNVGALPDELLESELFGAEAGAYTGSKKLRVGRFEAADGGTLFLDEIGNLSHAGQMKLLRVLQSREFERLGSSQTRRVDVRVICATNADLPLAIAKGQFREDLFFRLNVIELAVPPLRERPEDVLPLVRATLTNAAGSPPGEPFSLSAASERALVSHSWPGNVRELLNRLQRATLVARGKVLTPSDLGFVEGEPVPGRPAADSSDPCPDERASLEALLSRHAGSVSRAADEIGVSRQALYRRMERLGIVLERRPSSPGQKS
jgi:DNA-binding NtrC family response regulator